MSLSRHLLRSFPKLKLRPIATQAIAYSPPPRHSKPRTLLLSGVTAYAAFSGFASLSPHLSHAFADSSQPSIPDASNLPDIVLYQYEVCPFCNKVRAYLDYHNIPYRVVEVDPLRKTELKEFSPEYRKVPIALVNGCQINGSRQVIEHVRDIVWSEQQPSTATEQKWLQWVDDRFIHLIAPNIYRSVPESLQTFEYISENAKFSAWQRSSIKYSGAMAMYFVGKKLKKKYDIEDEREAIVEALSEWTEAIKQGGGTFLGGAEVPGMADLSVYGVLKAIQTFDTFRDIRSRNQDLADWFDSTKEAIGNAAITGEE